MDTPRVESANVGLIYYDAAGFVTSVVLDNSTWVDGTILLGTDKGTDQLNFTVDAAYDLVGFYGHT